MYTAAELSNLFLEEVADFNQLVDVCVEYDLDKSPTDLLVVLNHKEAPDRGSLAEAICAAEWFGNNIDPQTNEWLVEPGAFVLQKLKNAFFERNTVELANDLAYTAAEGPGAFRIALRELEAPQEQFLKALQTQINDKQSLAQWLCTQPENRIPKDKRPSPDLSPPEFAQAMQAYLQKRINFEKCLSSLHTSEKSGRRALIAKVKAYKLHEGPQAPLDNASLLDALTTRMDGNALAEVLARNKRFGELPNAATDPTHLILRTILGEEAAASQLHQHCTEQPDSALAKAANANSAAKEVLDERARQTASPALTVPSSSASPAPGSPHSPKAPSPLSPHREAMSPSSPGSPTGRRPRTSSSSDSLLRLALKPSTPPSQPANQQQFAAVQAGAAGTTVATQALRPQSPTPGPTPGGHSPI